MRTTLNIDEDVLALGDSKLGIDRLAFDEIDAVQLADLMRTRKYKFDPGWAAGYAYLLNGDERWKQSLDPGDPAQIKFAGAMGAVCLGRGQCHWRGPGGLQALVQMGGGGAGQQNDEVVVSAAMQQLREPGVPQ